MFFLTFFPTPLSLQGFAVSLQVILSHPKAVFKRRGSQPGMQESDFLKQITTVEELEPKANNCTKVPISTLKQKAFVSSLQMTVLTQTLFYRFLYGTREQRK